MPLTRSSKQYKVMHASRRRRRADTRLKRTIVPTKSSSGESMACVLYHHPNDTQSLSSKRLLGTKRVYSETEESGESEEESSTIWNGEQYICHGGVPYVLDASLAVFLHLMEDEVICNFLWMDSCAKLSDRYLLAMVYVYFKRASLSLEEYTRYNFFVGLYLANDMEEDDEDEKYEIFPWVFGKDWMRSYPSLLAHRDLLWSSMGFRAVVSKKTCDEVISLSPDHRIWKRHRLPHHGGAIRSYVKPVTRQYGRSSPQYCQLCTEVQYGLGVNNSLWPSVGEHHKFDLLDDIDCNHRLCHNPGPLSHLSLSSLSFNSHPHKEE